MARSRSRTASTAKLLPVPASPWTTPMALSSTRSVIACRVSSSCWVATVLAPLRLRKCAGIAIPSPSAPLAPVARWWATAVPLRLGGIAARTGRLLFFLEVLPADRQVEQVNPGQPLQLVVGGAKVVVCRLPARHDG